MKKIALFFLIISITVTVFAVPTFASEGCDASLDYHAIASEQFHNDDFNAALASVNCGLSFEPSSYALYMLRAEIYCHTGLFDLAIADMTTAISLRPDSAYAYNNRGWANYLAGNLDEAMSNLNTAIDLDEELAYAYNNRGLVHHTLGERDLALADYRTAIDLGLVQPWAEINLYNLNFEMATMEMEEEAEGLVHDHSNCG